MKLISTVFIWATFFPVENSGSKIITSERLRIGGSGGVNPEEIYNKSIFLQEKQ